MPLTLRPVRFSARRLAALVTSVLLAVTAASSRTRAQSPPFPTPLPACFVPPSPATDGWPVTNEDSLGSTAAMPVTFSGASLLANDTGASIALSGIDQVSTSGGRITGTDPFTYTPPALFVGTDTFSYEIRDAAAQTTIGRQQFGRISRTMITGAGSPRSLAAATNSRLRAASTALRTTRPL